MLCIRHTTRQLQHFSVLEWIERGITLGYLNGACETPGAICSSVVNLTLNFTAFRLALPPLPNGCCTGYHSRMRSRLHKDVLLGLL